MSGGLWRQPTQLDGGNPATDSATEELLRAVTRAVGAGDRVAVERQRLAGRSNIHVVSTPVSVRGHRRWVVKQPHTAWSQDDVSNPLSAEKEFEALMAESAIPWRWIGTTGGERCVLRMGSEPIVDLGLDRVEHAWRNGFERHLA